MSGSIAAVFRDEAERIFGPFFDKYAPDIYESRDAAAAFAFALYEFVAVVNARSEGES